ncbi:MAG: DUF434 domain-containing protein [Alkalispirochaeta sp.]
MFDDATHDYRWLLDRGYPEHGSLALVGDRYRLSREERFRLYRAVSAEEIGRRRAARVISPTAIGIEDTVGVDGHNVVLTVANYLRGIPVFITDDGVIRDVGGVHGRLHDPHLMERAIDLVAAAIREFPGARGMVCFDEPLSHSRQHAHRMREQLPPKWSVRLDRSADAALAAIEPTVVATSDSVVIDQVDGAVFDLARWVLDREFDARFV